MKICPKCGYERQPKDDAFVSPRECPQCGIVYEKATAFTGEELYGLDERPGRTEAANLQYAGFWIRVAASLIDGFLMVLMTTPIMVNHYGWDYYIHSERMFHGLTEFIVTWVLPALATLAFWEFKAATPGKMAVGAKIIDAKTGGKPSLGQYVGRYFAYFLSGIFFCLGFLWVAFDGRKQGWHDKLAGTLVVRRKRPDTVTLG